MSLCVLLTKETGALSLSVWVLFGWLGSSKPKWLESILCLAAKRLELLGEAGSPPGVLPITVGCGHWDSVTEHSNIQSVAISLMICMTDQ